MKIKVPKRIKIGVINCGVLYRHFLKADDDLRGAFNERTSEIQIDPVGGDTIIKTFMHEIVHIISRNYEVQLNEEDTTRIANGILEFLESLEIELDWSDID